MPPTCSYTASTAATGTHLPQQQPRRTQDGMATDTGIILGEGLGLARESEAQILTRLRQTYSERQGI
ncbi:hypothetical protein E2C01_102347 [Portunus trituberculatus]|uniref:Uncharacterized protein n=1 Tax=Portunus trituberculatus TaxID=210409 RepID=A0A5B7K7Y7_PORTR|nr:hypothetical protein [Portunus trituberculatus]